MGERPTDQRLHEIRQEEHKKMESVYEQRPSKTVCPHGYDKSATHHECWLTPAVHNDPVAYLKRWTEKAEWHYKKDHDRVRVDLYPELDPWMVGATVTPLYERPSDEKEAHLDWCASLKRPHCNCHAEGIIKRLDEQIAIPPNVVRYKVQQNQGEYALKGCDDGDLVDWWAYEALLRRVTAEETDAGPWWCSECGDSVASKDAHCRNWNCPAKRDAL